MGPRPPFLRVNPPTFYHGTSSYAMARVVQQRARPPARGLGYLLGKQLPANQLRQLTTSGRHLTWGWGKQQPCLG